MKRLFLAFDLLPETKSEIALWRSSQLNKDNNSPRTRPVKTKNFHITISFLGLLDESREKEVIHRM